MGLALALSLAGCSGGEVKAEDVKSYQEAGLPAGEKPITANPSSEGGATTNDANAQPTR